MTDIEYEIKDIVEFKFDPSKVESKEILKSIEMQQDWLNRVRGDEPRRYEKLDVPSTPPWEGETVGSKEIPPPRYINLSNDEYFEVFEGCHYKEKGNKELQQQFLDLTRG